MNGGYRGIEGWASGVRKVTFSVSIHENEQVMSSVDMGSLNLGSDSGSPHGQKPAGMGLGR